MAYIEHQHPYTYTSLLYIPPTHTAAILPAASRKNIIYKYTTGRCSSRWLALIHLFRRTSPAYLLLFFLFLGRRRMDPPVITLLKKWQSVHNHFTKSSSTYITRIYLHGYYTYRTDPFAIPYIHTINVHQSINIKTNVQAYSIKCSYQK